MSVPAAACSSAAGCETASGKASTYCFSRLDRWAGKPSQLLRVFLVSAEPLGDSGAASTGLRRSGSSRSVLVQDSRVLSPSGLSGSPRHVSLRVPSVHSGLCAGCLRPMACLRVMLRLSTGSLPSLCRVSSCYRHVLLRSLSCPPGSVLLLVATGSARLFSSDGSG